MYLIDPSSRTTRRIRKTSSDSFLDEQTMTEKLSKHTDKNLHGGSSFGSNPPKHTLRGN